MASGYRLPIWKKVIFGSFVTCAVFVLLEGLLAVVGVRATVETHDPFVGFASSLPLYVEKVDKDGQVVMTTAQNKLAYFNDQSFPRKKPAGTYRIFCLGGSTTYGRPYNDATSFPGWLRQLLPLADTESNWEVINAGGISYASYRVAAVMEELTQYEPDLFIIYTGHNEFLEERAYGDMRDMSPPGRELIAKLAHTRTFALLNRCFGTATPTPADRHQMSAEVDAVLDHTVGPSSYHRDDELTSQILAHFELNLLRMFALARGSGADVMIVTPACNLKDFSPFKSEHSFKNNTEEYQRWSEYFEQARTLEASGNLERALAVYQAAEKIDDRYADLHFQKARVLQQLKRYVEATAAFKRAAKEDVCPLRAMSELSEKVRKIASQEGVPTVDFQSQLQNECLRRFGHNAPGNEYFLDHVHPNIATNGMLARAIVDRLIQLRIVTASQSWDDSAVERARQQIESQIDDVEHAVALRNLAKVLNWAGKHHEAGPLALQALETLPDDPECLFLSAAYLKITGSTEQAIKNFRMTLLHNPDYVEAHQLLGAALVEQGEFEQALVHFKQVIRLRPDDIDAIHMIGAVLAELRRFDEAMPYYRQALESKPNDAHLRYNVALALAELGKRGESISEYKRCVRLNPNDAAAHNNLGALLAEEGQLDEAISHFQMALKIEPDSVDFRANLQDATRRSRNRR